MPSVAAALTVPVKKANVCIIIVSAFGEREEGRGGRRQPPSAAHSRGYRGAAGSHAQPGTRGTERDTGARGTGHGMGHAVSTAHARRGQRHEATRRPQLGAPSIPAPARRAPFPVSHGGALVLGANARPLARSRTRTRPSTRRPTRGCSQCLHVALPHVCGCSVVLGVGCESERAWEWVGRMARLAAPPSERAESERRKARTRRG